MSFEEKFPSLTAGNESFNLFDWKMVEEHCLDKQKVIEAINESYGYPCTCDYSCGCALEYIKGKLGLE